MKNVGYLIERKKDRTVFNGYRLLYQAKIALAELCAYNEYKIIAINEYQGYKFEGPHMYYIEYDGTKFKKYKR